MPKTTLTLTSGKTIDVEVDGSTLVTPLSQQQPAYLVANGNKRTVLNMRNVVALDYEVEAPAEPAPEPAPEPTPEPAPADRTVGELKEALDKAGIQYDAKAVKADLVKLVEDNQVTV